MSCTADQVCVGKVCRPKPVEPPPVDPPPSGEGCSIDGEPGPPIPDHRASLGEAVNAAIRRLRPDCEVGGTCLLFDRTRACWQRDVIAELKKASLCAGEHDPGVTDEIAVATSATAAREGYKVFSGDDSDNGNSDGQECVSPVSPGGARRTVQWYPNAYRGAYSAPATPPTGEAVCPAPQPPRVWTEATLPPGWGTDMIGTPSWMLNCRPHVPAPVIDCTHVVGPRQCGYCQDIGMGELEPGIPRCECPVRPENDPNREGCETWLARGLLELQSRNGATCVRVAPTMFEANGGNCRLCSPGGAVCGAWF